jgi:hypothetical protein
MTFSRKGSRKISVDGVDYRWKAPRSIVKNPASNEYYVEHVLHVEPVDSDGFHLEAHFDSRVLLPESSRIKMLDFLSISPGVVAAAIRHARGQGWTLDGATTRSQRHFRISDAGKLFLAELTKAAQKSGPTLAGWHSPHKR